MDVCERLLSSVGRLLERVENELLLIKSLVSDISHLQGADDKCLNALLLEYNIKVVEQKYIAMYYQALKTESTPRMSLKSLVSLHLSVLEEIQITSFVCEVQGHQMALSELLDRTLHNHGDIPELIIESVHLFFPFEEVCVYLSDSEFMSQFLGIVQNLSVANRKSSIVSVYRLFGEYAETDKFVYLLVSEILVDIFLETLPSPSLADFEFVERCKIVMFRDNCPLPVDLSGIKCELKERDAVAPFYFKEFSPVFDAEVVEMSPKSTPSMRHIVTQLRRMKWQQSVSMKLYCILKAVEFLNRLLNRTLERLSGADESFQYFVGCLVDVRNQGIPSLVECLHMHCFHFVKDSRMGFLIQLLRSATEFISSFMLPKPERIAFPFKLHVTDDEIGLCGFQVFEFLEVNEYPSLIRYTGQVSDKATVFLSACSDEHLNAGYRIVQTIDFCFFEVTEEMLKKMECAVTDVDSQ